MICFVKANKIYHIIRAINRFILRIPRIGNNPVSKEKTISIPPLEKIPA